MDDRRRKLKFRAWRRGFRELDLLMGSFADLKLENMTPDEVDEFERLLEVPDWEIYAWLTGNADIPEDQKGPLLDQLCQFKYSAQPG
jgi:Uncharacterized conserved protein